MWQREVGVTQVTVILGEVGVSIPIREEGRAELRSRSEGRETLSQLWPFRDTILTALWMVD